MPLPRGFVPPCLPTNAPQPPTGDAWLHEIRYDGAPPAAKAGVALTERSSATMS